MDKMGPFRTTVGVEDPGRRGLVRSLNDVLVDTGSELTWIPRSLLEELGLNLRIDPRSRRLVGAGPIVAAVG